MKIVLNIALLLVFSFSYAQKRYMKKAEELYDGKYYIEAAKTYEQLKKPDQQAMQRLGDSYYYNNEMVAASKVYAKLYGVYKDKLEKEYLFRYGHSLKAIQDYEKADKIFKEYYGFEVNTQKFIDNLEENVFFDYQSQSMTKELETGDFGLAFWNDKVVFSAIRSEDSPLYSWNEKPYLDLYMADLQDDGTITNIEPFSSDINTDTHDASAVFTKDGKTIYFCRTSDKRVKLEEKGKEIAVVKLFKAELIDSVWTNIVQLPFASDNYSTQNPALSEDESRLYFASDMPGTLGSLDIFYVDILEDGTFGTPVNVGDKVNTPHREQFPFEINNELYFASDGHEGFGNLDIFVSHLTDGEYGIPENLGKGVNTGYDDFAFVLTKDGKKGYFSSNRKGLLDNMYSFERTRLSRKFTIEGDVRDITSLELLPGTRVSLYDEEQRLISQVVVGSNARYVFASKPFTKYRIEAVRNLYIPFIEEVETNEEGRVYKNIELLMMSYDDAEEIIHKKDDGLTYVQLENIYFDLDKWDIKPEAEKVLNVLVDLMKKYPLIEIELGAHTDSRASEIYNITLSNKRAKASVDYIISQGIQSSRIKWKGYGESKPLVRCGDDCSEEEHAINRRCEFIILK
ncbi:MAG: OmpA family protein [Bacteroidota bacterium]|nr:OmpA family protein [Bacteroidota bacterium]